MSDAILDPRSMDAADFKRYGHDRTSRGSAIRGMCLQCMGGSAHEVLLCASSPCPLWPFRMGTDPWRAPMSEENREAASERMRALRGV